MEIAGLCQRDGVSCGPSVAVIAGALLNPGYRAGLGDPDWFHAEQDRVHRGVNRIWPRRLGTTPRGLVRAVNRHSVLRYRWRMFRGSRDPLTDVLRAVGRGWPVPVLIGDVLPRHWILLVDVEGPMFRCYEPTSGRLLSVASAELRQSRLAGLGFSRPHAFVLPSSGRRAWCR